jgi:hypothetical protein
MRSKNQDRVKGRFAPCEYTPQEAFELLQSLPVGQRTLRAHGEAMSKAGKQISIVTLRKWRIRHNWEGRLDLSTGRQVQSTHEVLETLKKVGAEMSPEVLDGLLAELIKRLLAAIQTMECRSLNDAEGIASLISKAVDLRQRLAGDQGSISEDDDPDLGEIPDFSRPRSN